jgi:hypothetical protein
MATTTLFSTNNPNPGAAGLAARLELCFQSAAIFFTAE